ncbi:hypothetical protein TeGR_g10123 [Tetraparma gracilis]|uniref:PCI domain-containing protein n=1 Tax=Tetraparma gracilis TaxID=2962635 RepID=A0ABQ6N7W5_9STRA|nr:hypothetical protein TeGR_g10123 [Tetraparma gracilis]
MATLVNLSPSAELSLVQILGESLSSEAFIADCTAHIAAADAPSLLGAFLAPAAVEGLFGLGDEDSVHAAVALLASLVGRCPAAKQAEHALALVAAVVGHAAAPPALRLSLLVSVYNLRPKPEKHRLLLAVLAFAASSSLAASLSAVYADPAAVISELALDGPQTRELHLALAAAHEPASQASLTAWLRTFDGPGPLAMDAKELETAARAVKAALADPVGLFRSSENLTDMRAVAELKKSPATAPLVTLLEVFVSGSLSDWQAFASSNAALLAKESLDSDKCVESMRLLSLVSLASKNPEVPYSAVAETLQVPLESVEGWVVQAVTAGLLVARMDQARQVVAVERCVHRAFGEQEWKELKGRLDKAKENLRQVRENYVEQVAKQASKK